MQIWQYWMELGNQAYFTQDWPQAQHCYQQALADVWPVWLESTLGAAAEAGTLQQLPDNELCLPSCCLAVTVRNLANCHRAAGQPGRSRALLKQTQRWFCCALQQAKLPASLYASLLNLQADLHEALLHCAADPQPQEQNRIVGSGFTAAAGSTIH
jgi:hypothetical protein